MFVVRGRSAVVMVVVMVFVHIVKGQHLLQLTYKEDQGKALTHLKATSRAKPPHSRAETRGSVQPPRKPDMTGKTRKRKLFKVVQVEDVEGREDVTKNNALDTPAIEVSGFRGRYGAKGQSWSPWGVWSPCSVSCGRGRQYRFRVCLSRACEGRRYELQECKKRRCRS